MTRTRRIVVGASAAVAAAALAVGVGVAVSDHNPSPAGAASQPAGGVESACGLSGTPGDSTAGATAATWSTVPGGWSMPSSTTDGPGIRSDEGPWSCYSRTRSGAVLAAYVIPLRIGIVSDRDAMVRQQTIPGPGQAVLLGSTANLSKVEAPRGFYVAAYSPDAATIRYRLTTATGDYACTTDVRWSDGDWRLVVGDDGSTSSGCIRGVPDQFTPWGP